MMRTDKEFNLLYKKKNPFRVLESNDTRNVIIKKIIETYQTNKTLELGCGEGNFTQYLKKKHLTCNDISSIALNRAKIKYPKIKIINGDMLKINLTNNKVFIFSTPITGFTDNNFTDKELKKIFKELNVSLINEKKLNVFYSNKYKLDFFIRLIIKIIFKLISICKLKKYSYLILNILPERFIYQKVYVLKKS